MGNGITKKQHIIPQMMLKKIGFFHIPMSEPLLYQLDIYSNIERITRAKEICKKNNLYETRDNKGMIREAERNMIEKHLSRMEAVWNPLINRIVKCEGVSNNDMAWLYALMAIQLLRTPEIISTVKEMLLDEFPSLNEYEADRCAKISSLMFGGIPLEASWLSRIIIENLAKKQITILHSSIPFIIGQQRPVLYLKKGNAFFLPIEKNTCLNLKGQGEIVDSVKHENIDNTFTHFINHETLQNEGRLFYCSESMLPYLKGFSYVK